MSSVLYAFIPVDLVMLNRQVHEIFNLWFFHQTIPYWSLIRGLKYFRISLRIRRERNKYVWSSAMPHSAGLLKKILCAVDPELCRQAQDQTAYSA
jgi:hypothetical protein